LFQRGVADRQATTGPDHARDLAKHSLLVGCKIDDALTDDNIT
jgi:hypothetical protein